MKEKKQNDFAAFIKRRIKGQRGVILKLLFIGLLLVVPGIVLPVLSQVFIDDILIGGNSEHFGTLIAFMLAAVALQAGLTVYRGLLLSKLQKKMTLLSAREFLYVLFRLPMSFFDRRYAGDLSYRAADSARVSEFLSDKLAETALNIFAAVFYLALCFVYSPPLTAIAAATVIADAAVMKISSDIISNASVKLRQDYGKLAGVVCAGISITPTLKASGAENEYISKILGYNARSICTEQKLSKTQRIVNAIPSAARRLGDVIILTAGGMFVINGDMTIGMLIAFTSLFGSFSEPVSALAGFVKNIQTTKADAGRVEDVMRYPLDSKFDDSVEKKPIRTKLEGSVELRGVKFGYSKLSPPVVSDLSFKIDCGSSIAFVGESGCGKSTVSKLVSRLYKPWEGELYFDGINADEIPNEIFSAGVSSVSQNITLFSGTIRDNLTMWNENISEADMVAAAKDACIHDIITGKPGAYDYMLTEGGSNLSGGQRQRLEIARALATNPTVLIMDEATSALDPIVEKQIMDNIKRRGCTCVVIAHRLSAIRDCGRIFVLRQGKIVQSGTHEELSAADGQYRSFMANI